MVVVADEGRPEPCAAAEQAAGLCRLSPRDEKLEKALPNKPTIIGGEVVVQKVRELVKA